VDAPIRRRNNRSKTQPWLNRNWTRGRHEDSVGIFVAHVVVRRPGDFFRWIGRKAEQFILESVCRFNLVGPIDRPPIHGEFIVHLERRADSHVIERQVVEIERPRIVHLVLGVVAFEAQ
jgi:hypothetical protein